MKILKIERKQSTEEENYTLITFKTFFSGVFSETCITPKLNVNTFYAKTGESLPFCLWKVVESFLRTDDKIHEYEKGKK